MSAYVVSDNHINELIRFIDTRFYLNKSYLQRVIPEIAFIRDDKLFFERVGQELLNENYRSVNYRYKNSEDEEKCHKFSYKEKLGEKKLKPVEILKLVACLDYQSCETDNWETTRAYKILESIKSFAINQLDGYNEASWGIN